MNIKNGDIWLAREALQTAMKLPPEALTVRGKYYIAKLSRKLSGPFQDIEATRVKLIQQYGKKTEKGWEVSPGEATRVFQESFAETLAIETEVDWSPITLTDKDAEALSVAEIIQLDQFIAFPEPKEAMDAPGNGVVKEAEALVKK